MHDQSHDPLHGVTLATIVELLYKHYGWKALGDIIPIRCFQKDPSIKSSLKFLRKTLWAREKVEALYIELMQNSDNTMHEPVDAESIDTTDTTDTTSNKANDPWHKKR